MSKKQDNPTECTELKSEILASHGTIRKFAEATGIERTQLYPILRGEAFPGLRNFVTMAEALDMDYLKLVNLLDVQARETRSRTATK